MARKFLVALDLGTNELQNAVIQNLPAASEPTGVKGRIYFDSTNNKLKVYNGTAWVNLATSGVVALGEDTTGDYVATLASSAGTITVTGSGTETAAVNVDLPSTGVTADSYGSTTKIPTFTVDQYGRLTAAGEEDVATNLSIAGDTGTDTVSLLTDTLTVTGGTGITSSVTNNTVTIDIDSTVTTNDGTQTLTNKTIGTGGLTFNDGSNSSSIYTNGNDLTVSAPNTLYLNTNTGDIELQPDGYAKVYGDRIVTETASQTISNKTLGSDLHADGYSVTGLADPTNPQDAATKNYVDSVAAGLNWKPAVNLLADSNLALTGPSSTTIDGHALTSADGYRVLLTNQSTDSENGIYDVAVSAGAYTFTRSTDADVYTELVGAAVFVMEGTNYGSTSWVQADHYISSFAGQDWTQFSGAGTYLAGNGLTLTGNTFTIDETITATRTYAETVANTAQSNAETFATNAINALDTDDIEEGSTNLYFTDERAQDAVGGIVSGSNSLAVTYNDGTPSITFDTTLASTSYLSKSSGLAVDLSALEPKLVTDGFTKKYATNVGDNSATSFTVTHNLGTRDVQVQVYDNGTYDTVEVDVVRSSTSAVSISFATAPSTDAYRVVVIG